MSLSKTAACLAVLMVLLNVAAADQGEKEWGVARSHTSHSARIVILGTTGGRPPAGVVGPGSH